MQAQSTEKVVILDTKNKRPGGLARAKALSPKRRQEIAKQAAQAKSDIARNEATALGNLRIADKTISCVVTQNGTRLIRAANIFETFGRTPRGYKKLNRTIIRPPFMDAINLEPYISANLEELLKPEKFKDVNGKSAMGYKAEVLPEICLTYLKAERAKALAPSQKRMAELSHIIIAALSTVGIIALVDEATGYQKDRAKDALAKILEAFIDKELRDWVKTFPTSFYEELFRLNGMELTDEALHKKPIKFANMTNNIVYQRLAPGLLDELKRVSARNEKGNLKHRYHQRLSSETGYVKLKEHLASVISIMKLSDDYQDFKTKLERLHPKCQIETNEN
jgi:hypothetical protein